ncbi:hypothetical protein KQX54_000448, partial [Cotesia glomerata]
MPRGKWYCSNCHASKQPKKRNSSRRSHTKSDVSPTPSTIASNTNVEDAKEEAPNLFQQLRRRT